jgi:quinol-cytochrome oxidoreductase complex cytochrome b subunit
VQGLIVGVLIAVVILAKEYFDKRARRISSASRQDSHWKSVLYGDKEEELNKRDSDEVHRSKNKFKYSKKAWVFLVLIVLLAYGLFYWLAIRPTHIRQYCSDQSSDVYIKGHISRGDYYLIYNNCLHARGL